MALNLSHAHPVIHAEFLELLQLRALAAQAIQGLEKVIAFSKQLGQSVPGHSALGSQMGAADPGGSVWQLARSLPSFPWMCLPGPRNYLHLIVIQPTSDWVTDALHISSLIPQNDPLSGKILFPSHK